MRLELAPLAIGELLAGLVEDFRPQATDRRLELSLVLPDYGLPILRADRARLAQVFNNLLANALIACAEGGRIELRAAVAPAGDRLDVLCVDDGVGIAPEERERIFERFYRLDSSRNRRSGGSGLGLAISRELVRLHGGSLTAEANPAGRGSLLRVSLPLSAPGGSA
ncbi:MAG TPA: hypothetical protein DCX65_08525 [Spirochaetaceae bacterium]|nr:hypothetical protein [Spirochaetaceae bacterium]